jgi:hypothetical protein
VIAVFRRPLRAGRDRAAAGCPSPPAAALAWVDRLLRTERQVEILRGVLVATAAMALAVPMWRGPSRPALVVTAVLTALMLVLLAALLLLIGSRRRLSLAAIAAGEDDVPLATVTAVRRGLYDRGRRVALADSLRYWATPITWRELHPATRVPLWPHLDETCRHGLDRIAARLRCDASCPAAAVAACELLLSSSDTPLFGSDRGALAAELQRIEDLLDAAPPR